jgi:hypothetical protein
MIALKGKPDIGDRINKEVIAQLVEANSRLARSDFPDFDNPRVEGPLAFMELTQFSVRERSDAILRDQCLQLRLCVDAPIGRARGYERRARVLILAKENRFLQCFGKDHRKRQPQQVKQRPFVVFQCVGKGSRATASRFNRQRVAPSLPSFRPRPAGRLKQRNRCLGHRSKIPVGMISIRPKQPRCPVL